MSLVRAQQRELIRYQIMEVKLNDNPTPHLLLENVFTDDELESIWTELKFLRPNFLDASKTGSAKDEDNETLLKNNTGLFMYELYKNNSISPILNNVIKVAWYSSLADYWYPLWIKSTYENTNWDSVLVSYYENGNYYHPHSDVSMFTMLIWLWKEPKKFLGGNLYFPNHDYIVECKNNCGIIFLSGEKHGVTPVELSEEEHGRYCITMFSGIGLYNTSE